MSAERLRHELTYDQVLCTHAAHRYAPWVRERLRREWCARRISPEAARLLLAAGRELGAVAAAPQGARGGRPRTPTPGPEGVVASD